MSVYIIAEAGINHNGDMNIAMRMAMAARDVDADCVKFQTYKADAICRSDSPQYDMLKRCELSYDNFRLLSKHCQVIGIEFMSTPDTIEDALFLDTLGMRYMKIGSANANQPFVDSLRDAGVKTPLIVSTGMNAQVHYNNVIASFLHCVSAYPVPDDQANMCDCEYGNGFSDHTIGSVAAIMAVARGATIIEKHFTLDKTMDGPDHHMSMDPDELRQYVKDIRRAEKMLGDGVRRMMPCEEATKKLLAERR